MEMETMLFILIGIGILSGIIMLFYKLITAQNHYTKAKNIMEENITQTHTFSPPIISINKGLEKAERIKTHNLHPVYNPNVKRDERGRFASIKNVVSG